MYKYRPIEEVIPGDIVEFVDNSCYTHNPVGTIHIVGGVRLNDKELFNLTPPLEGMSTPKQYRFKLIATKPGSEAQVGDTLIRIKGNSMGCPLYSTFTVHKGVLSNSLYYKQRYSIYKSEGLVLCKADDTLLHQHWKNLYDQGVKLEFRNIAHNTTSVWYRLTYADKIASTFNYKHIEYRIKPQPKHELAMAKRFRVHGWYVHSLNDTHCFLRPDLTVKDGTGYHSRTNIGYWPTEAEANLARAQYLGEQMVPEIKIGSHWQSKEPHYTRIVVVSKTTKEGDISYENNKYCINEVAFREHFKPRPDLDEPTTHSNVEPQSTTKEQPMDKTTLKLLLALMGASTETVKDATNSNYIGIITNSNDEYLGYIYCNSIKEIKEIAAKPSNEGNTIHAFKFADSYTQATRPVVKVTRNTVVDDAE